MASFLMFLLAVVWLLYQLFSEKPCPPGNVYDDEKSKQDLIDGVGVREWNRRQKKGYYYSTPEEIEKRQKAKEVIPGVVDVERYKRDREWFGVMYAEENRKAGRYKYVIKMKKMNE